MKKVTLTAVIALSVVVGISNKSLANTTGTDGVSTELTNVKNINEIEVHGNVKVYLTNGDTDKVKVYDAYYNQNALVQEDANVLRITSYGSKQLVVLVTVNNLTKLSAFDNAQVQSFGKFSALDLTVSLNNHAAAQLDMDAFTASVTVNDRADASLTGHIENGTLHYDRWASLNTANLTGTTNKIENQNMSERPMKHFHRNLPPVLHLNDITNAAENASI